MNVKAAVGNSDMNDGDPSGTTETVPQPDGGESERTALDNWLDELIQLPPVDVDPEAVREAIAAVKDELSATDECRS